MIFSHVLQTYLWSQNVPFVWRLNPGATGVSGRLPVATTMDVPELHLSLPVALTGALASGVASYWLVEQTGLRWRKRLEQKVFARD